MNISLKNTLIALTLLAGSGLSYATEMPFSLGQGQNLEFGTQKKEMYEVALRILPGQFEGGKIKGVQVPVRTQDISDVRLWLTHNLNVELVDGKNITVADILTKDAEVADGLAAITLDTPYEIPAEGLYVGYTFDVVTLTEDTKWPLFVSESTSNEGFYFRSSRSYREWQNFAPEYRIATELSIDIDYDFAPNSVELVSLSAVRANYGEPFTVPAIIETHGYVPVTSIDFDYEFGDQKGSTHFVLPMEVPAIYGRRLNVELPFDECEERFNHPLTVTVTKVNNETNVDPSPSAIGAVNIINHTAKHRIVMEEYTGSWCGFCVKGTAAIERMLSLYPDDFIPIAIHGGSDPMVSMEIFPNYIPGYPHCWIDRAFDCDPYDGLYGDEFFGMEKTFLERRALPAPADIDINATFDGNDINVTSVVNFVEIPDHQYKLAYLLLEDHMKGLTKEWAQSNYYAGNNPDKYIPEMERFCKGDSYIRDIEYNEVVVMSPDIMGVPGSVNYVDTDTPIVHEYKFANIDQAVNVYNKPIIQNRDNLSVVVMLIDTYDGHIANANKLKLGTTSVEGLESELKEVKGYSWMSCDGKMTDGPVKGLNIRITHYTDGSSKTDKLIVK